MATLQIATRLKHPIIRGFQYTYSILSWIFTGLILLQTYLAGLGIFADGTMLTIHSFVGFMLLLVPILTFPFVLLGRFGGRIILWHTLLFLDILLQVALVTILHAFKQPALYALHPVNAIFLFTISSLLARHTWKWASKPE